ncbi:MAG TPA: hypothetical protein VIS57_06970 [Xanthomonadales bacterium]
MRAKMFLTMMSVFSLLLPASVLAHVTEPGAVLPHIFTGEHLLILIIVGVCIVGISRFHSRNR